MNFKLSADQLKLYNETLLFAKEELNNNIISRDIEHQFDIESWKKLGQRKITGLCIPVAYGGLGLSAIDTCLSLQALGEGCEDNGLCFAVAAHVLACLVPVWKFGTEKQKQSYLPKLCNGTLIAGNAMTESSGGSDAFNLNTTAILNENCYVLNGEKSFVTNGTIADILITYATSDKNLGFRGINTFILDKEEHSFIVKEDLKKSGLKTCKAAVIAYKNLDITPNYLLGRKNKGALLFNSSMEWERICLGAIHIGAMERILKQTIDLIRGNSKVNNNQSISHKLAKLKVNIEASKLLIYKAAEKLDENNPLGMDASIVKYYVSETYKEFSQQIFQIYASKAFKEGEVIDRLLRDAHASTIYSGTSEIQLNIIANKLGL